MPTAAPSRCTEPRCPNHGVPAYRGKCELHKPKPWVRKSQHTQRLTRKESKAIRAAQLAREPACRACGATDALEVDHIIEVSDGGALFDPENLQTLCEACHHDKTVRAAQARRNYREATD